MFEYQYLIVGGGMTADAAVRGIREVDKNGSIGLIGSEPDAPYNRPPLSKGLWKGDPIDSIWRETGKEGVVLHLGRKAQVLDVLHKHVTDDQGELYAYGKLLLATGGTPRRLPDEAPIIYYRTVEDYRRLRAMASEHSKFVVVGGGFIGSEVAAALAMNGRQVTLIFPEGGIGSRVFPADLAEYLNSFYREKGVEVLTGERIAGARADGSGVVVKTGSGREITADGVVAGLGIVPNVELAQAAGLKGENGIVVDEFLRTSQPDVYAAGDVAAFLNPALSKRIRVEHEDNANTMGAVVGRNMAGHASPYDHLPSFYSDLFDLGYEAVGELDSRLGTYADWKEPFREGVVYYLQSGKVRGVLLWNVWGKVDAARELIAEPGPFRGADLKGRISG